MGEANHGCLVNMHACVAGRMAGNCCWCSRSARPGSTYLECAPPKSSLLRGLQRLAAASLACIVSRLLLRATVSLCCLRPRGGSAVCKRMCSTVWCSLLPMRPAACSLFLCLNPDPQALQCLQRHLPCQLQGSHRSRMRAVHQASLAPLRMPPRRLSRCRLRRRTSWASTSQAKAPGSLREQRFLSGVTDAGGRRRWVGTAMPGTAAAGTARPH